VDTIDVLHLRAQGLRQRRMIPDGFLVAKETEAQLLALADYTIAIQAREAEVLREMLPPERVLLVEHGNEVPAVPDPPAPAQPIVTLVASDNPNNQDGFRWFLSAVWPRLLRLVPQAALHVYGRLSETPICQGPRVERRGFVPDVAEAYAQSYVAINPVRAGAGLKIKTVEGLSYGRAVVTTPVGGEGLEDGAGSAFLVADDPQQFAQTLANLLNNPAAARDLGQRARQYAERRFGMKQVYQPLLEVIAARQGALPKGL
jgi:glycosyltransferase involved in cell wall biosynthesis